MSDSMDTDPRVKPLQSQLSTLAKEENFVIPTRLTALQEELKLATFLGDGKQVADVRERYLAVIERRLDIHQSVAMIMKQLLDIAGGD